MAIEGDGIPSSKRKSLSIRFGCPLQYIDRTSISDYKNEYNPKFKGVFSQTWPMAWIWTQITGHGCFSPGGSGNRRYFPGKPWATHDSDYRAVGCSLVHPSPILSHRTAKLQSIPSPREPCPSSLVRTSWFRLPACSSSQTLLPTPRHRPGFSNTKSTPPPAYLAGDGALILFGIPVNPYTGWTLVSILTCSESTPYFRLRRFSKNLGATCGN